MNIKKTEIGTGDKAIFNTVQKMISLVNRDYNHSSIRKIATQIFSKCGGDELCLAQEGFNWVVSNVEYKFDHENVLNWIDKEELKSPANTEFLKAPKYLADPSDDEVDQTGDCDDMTTILCAIYKALGLRCRMRIIAWKNDSFTHVYPEVGLEQYKIWIPADPVIKIFGTEKAPVFRAKSFEV